ncbi:MAG: hypothetical protein OXP71_01625 [Candidatus Poribacteria bacterium]|nr:hypothetical protein [Candidatus Poribacteria bacterium]
MSTKPSYNSFQDTSHHHSLNSDEKWKIELQDVIELVFSRAVTQVIIEADNMLGNARPNGVPPTTIWRIQVAELGLWPLTGFIPERDVLFTVIYERKTNLYKETFDITLGGNSHASEPPKIDSLNVWNHQIDADANQLNHKGIRISFDTETDPHRTRIEVYSGRWKLNWKMYWTDRIKTAILLPESKNARLLPEHEYEIHLVDFYDSAGTRGKGLKQGSIVICFQTASE